MSTVELIQLLLNDVAEHGDREVRISPKSGPCFPIDEVYSRSSWIVFLRIEMEETL